MRFDNKSGIKFNIVTVLILTAVFLGVSGLEVNSVEAVPNLPAEEEIDELHQEIIDLALESSRTLKSQRGLLEEYEEITPEEDPGAVIDLDAGITGARDEDDGDYYVAPRAGISMTYPLRDAERDMRIIENRLSFLDSRTGQVGTIEESEQEIITSLNEHLNNLVELVNKIEGQQRLEQQLKDRSSDLEDMVEAGIAEPDNLWELDERINEIQTELKNLRSREIILINEISSNYGRENRAEMKDKLLQITSYMRDK